MDEINQASQTQQPTNSNPVPINNSGKSKVIPIILGIAAVVILAIGAYTLGSKQSQPVVQNTIQTTPIPSPTPTPLTMSTVDPSLTANWKTYQNTKYGFVIRYPNSLKLYETPGQIQTYIPQCDHVSLVSCLFYPHNLYNHPNFVGASVAIDAVKKDESTSEDIKTQADCKQYLEARLADQDKVSTKQINGTVFYYGTFSQGATGHLISEQHYASYYKNTCFYIILSVASDDVNPPFFTEEDNVFAQLDQILSTFQFTTP